MMWIGHTVIIMLYCYTILRLENIFIAHLKNSNDIKTRSFSSRSHPRSGRGPSFPCDFVDCETIEKF